MKVFHCNISSLHPLVIGETFGNWKWPLKWTRRYQINKMKPVSRHLPDSEYFSLIYIYVVHF